MRSYWGLRGYIEAHALFSQLSALVSTFLSDSNLRRDELIILSGDISSLAERHFPLLPHGVLDNGRVIFRTVQGGIEETFGNRNRCDIKRHVVNM